MQKTKSPNVSLLMH